MVAADDRWFRTLETLGVTERGASDVFDELLVAYADPPRKYHTIDHASAVVDVVLGIHSAGDAWAPAVAAAWFHDAIYDVTAAHGVNEGASAVMATRALERLGAPFTAVGEVARLICLTAGHHPRRGDRTGALLCDADLSILGAAPERYETSVADIRSEYQHVSDSDWRSGRAAVLRSFLDRPRLFQTDEARGRWESQARSNISTELEALVDRRPADQT